MAITLKINNFKLFLASKLVFNKIVQKQMETIPFKKFTQSNSNKMIIKDMLTIW